MKCVLPDILYLGNAADAANSWRVAGVEFTAVVALACEEPAISFPREWTALRIPLIDGAGNPPYLLRLAVDSLTLLMQHRCTTLVYCSAGMSRSPAIAAFALSELTGQAPEACLKEIESLGPCDVSPGLWNDLARMFDE
jgi:protein-tyrosine phosphatase